MPWQWTRPTFSPCLRPILSRQRFVALLRTCTLHQTTAQGKCTSKTTSTNSVRRQAPPSTHLAERIVANGHLWLGVNVLEIPPEALTLKSFTQLSSLCYVSKVCLLHTCHHMSKHLSTFITPVALALSQRPIEQHVLTRFCYCYY